MKVIRAIYEKGVFRPLEPVDLPEQCEVWVELAKSRPVQPGADPEKKLANILNILSERYHSPPQSPSRPPQKPQP